MPDRPRPLRPPLCPARSASPPAEAGGARRPRKTALGVKLLIGLKFIQEISGRIDFAPGHRMTGSFYKCGDNTPSPTLHLARFNLKSPASIFRNSSASLSWRDERHRRTSPAAGAARRPVPEKQPLPVDAKASPVDFSFRLCYHKIKPVYAQIDTKGRRNIWNTGKSEEPAARAASSDSAASIWTARPGEQVKGKPSTPRWKTASTSLTSSCRGGRSAKHRQGAGRPARSGPDSGPYRLDRRGPAV